MSQLAPLIIGLVIFFASHALPRFFGLRERLVASVGQNTYRGLHALLALMALALIVHGYASYRAAGYVPLWEVPRFFNHIAILLVWPAMILLAATFLPGTIKAKARHPMLAAVKLWALVHIIVNGDLGSLILFGSFLLWAVLTRIRLKRAGAGELLPGAEALAPSRRNDALAVLIGTGITLAMVFGLHAKLIGVPVL